MGGHLTHGRRVVVAGKWLTLRAVRGSRDTHRIDLDEVRDLALRERPKIIFGGGTAYSRRRLRGLHSIAARWARSFADIAHIAGPDRGRRRPTRSIFDIVTTTTHKTLRGPRGAIIMCKAEQTDIDRTVFPGIQGGPHDHIKAAKAVAATRRPQPSFRVRGTFANAQALAGELMGRGYDLVSGGTDNHLMLVDLTARAIAGKWRRRPSTRRASS